MIEALFCAPSLSFENCTILDALEGATSAIQWLRGSRAPSPETLYYGRNTTYALTDRIRIALLVVVVWRQPDLTRGADMVLSLVGAAE